MEGWIKLWRELIDKPVWQLSSPEQKTILITLLLMANHERAEWEWKGEKFVCQPGQFITSLESIARKAGKGITIQNVRTAIQRFEKLGFLTNESTKTGRCITIENYTLYQRDNEQDNKDTGKELTKNQQSTNKELTTNKNDKNNKNITADNDIAESFQLLEKCGFVIDAFTAETLTSWIEELSAEWVQEAIRRSAKQGARKLSYVESILRNWKMKGAIDEGYGRDKQTEKSSGSAERRDYSDANGIRFD